MGKIFQRIKHLLNGSEIVIFHEFHKPPYGGGNQFLIALEKELIKLGVDVGRNTIGRNTKACLFNSFNFDAEKLLKLRNKYKMRMVHRLAGPIGVYRGTDIEVDRDTQKLNERLADATVFISNYSANKYKDLGLNYKNPTVIVNSTDSEIFNSLCRITDPDGARRIKLIATAWSNNPKKGGPLLSWLDEHLDHSKYELTFVGRTKAVFKGARIIDPVPSDELAKILKQHDIYIAPSEDDPCSNALIEALASGLPTAYLSSGGHPELVGEAGEGFTNGPTALEAIEKIANNIPGYRAKISISSMQNVAKEYLRVLTSNT